MFEVLATEGINIEMISTSAIRLTCVVRASRRRPGRRRPAQSLWARPGGGLLMGFSVGVYGATGQVGGVMRQILREREFPVDRLRLFASERSAGQVLDGVAVEDVAVGRPQGHRYRPFQHGCTGVSRVGAGRGRRRCDRHRQFEGVADGPRGPARRARGKRRRPRDIPQRYRRQPELHDDGLHARAEAAPR